ELKCRLLGRIRDQLRNVVGELTDGLRLGSESRGLDRVLDGPGERRRDHRLACAEVVRGEPVRDARLPGYRPKRDAIQALASNDPDEGRAQCGPPVSARRHFPAPGSSSHTRTVTPPGSLTNAQLTEDNGPSSRPSGGEGMHEESASSRHVPEQADGMTRRELLKVGTGGALLLGAGGLLGAGSAQSAV